MDEGCEEVDGGWMGGLTLDGWYGHEKYWMDDFGFGLMDE